MPWVKPSLKELIDYSEEQLSIRLLDGSPVEPRSVIKTIASMFGGGSYLMYEFLYWAFKQIFPHLADDEYMTEWAKVWGVIRKLATGSEGQVTIRGTAGSSVMDNTLAIIGNSQYRLAGVTLTGTEGVCQIESVFKGKASNLAEGTKLTLVSPQPGINSEIIVGPGDLEGGVDEESDAELRARLLKVIQSPPHGGNKADYEMWALEVPGVVNAMCIPTPYRWLGVVWVAIWGDVREPILDEVVVKNAYEYLLKMCPVTAGPGLYVFTPATLPVDVTLKIFPDTPQIRENIIYGLEDVFLIEAKPGVMIPLTHLAEAISLATGEYDHKLMSPTDNIMPDITFLPILGNVTFVES
jgi:uncharacterized phage protein gp47/JayE